MLEPPDTETDPNDWIGSLRLCEGSGNGTPLTLSSKLLVFFLLQLLPLFLSRSPLMKFSWKAARGSSSSSSSSGCSCSSLLLLHFLFHQAGILIKFNSQRERRRFVLCCELWFMICNMVQKRRKTDTSRWWWWLENGERRAIIKWWVDGSIQYDKRPYFYFSITLVVFFFFLLSLLHLLSLHQIKLITCSFLHLLTWYPCHFFLLHLKF